MSFLDNARRAFKSKSDEFFDDSEYEQEYEEYEDEPRKPLFSFLSKKADEYEDDVEYEDEPESYSSTHSRTSTREKYTTSYQRQTQSAYSAPVSANLNGVHVVVHYPATFDDAVKIIREVKGNKITVFDISTITSDDEARRVVDYIGGAAEGMECPFKRLCPSIFCIAPKGVTLETKNHRF